MAVSHPQALPFLVLASRSTLSKSYFAIVYVLLFVVAGPGAGSDEDIARDAVVPRYAGLAVGDAISFDVAGQVVELALFVEIHDRAAVQLQSFDQAPGVAL